MSIDVLNCFNKPLPLTLYRLNKSRAHRVLWLLEELKVDYELKVYKRGADMVGCMKPLSFNSLLKLSIARTQRAEGCPPTRQITSHLCPRPRWPTSSDC
jgi:glutathione S-transferase